MSDNTLAGRGQHSGRGVVVTVPHLAATPRTTLWGSLPSESDAPVLTVDPGQRIAIDIAAHGEHDLSAGPHVVTGPIAVRGARPGDWLSIRIDALRRRAAYGVI